MFTKKEQELIDRLKENGRKIEADYEAGLITKEKYEKYNKLLEEAADKIEAISSAGK